MRIKVMTGSDPLGLCKYIQDEKKQQQGQPAQIVTNMFGTNPEEWAEEFRFSHTLNTTGVEVTMVHFSFSLPPGERVEPETRSAITKHVLGLMGYGDCMYIEGEHFDQSDKNDVQHWHCGVSTIDLDGNHVSDKRNYEKLRGVEQQVEEEFDLVRTTTRPERERNNLKTGEFRMRERLGIETPTEKLWGHIREATRDQPTFEIMAARLKAEGVGVQFKEVENEIVGISFEMDGALRKGRNLGKQYSFVGLQRNEFVLEYEPSQAEQLRQIQNLTPEQCQQFLETQSQQQNQNNLQQEHDRLHQEYAFAQQKPKLGGVQWKRAKGMLHYIDDRINETNDTDIQDDRFLIDWNEQTRRLTVAEKGESPHVIVQGEPKGEADWEVLHADVSLESWQHFQNRVRESAAANQQEREIIPTQVARTQSSPELEL